MRFNPRDRAWTFDSKTKTFSAEASDLGWRGLIPSEFQFYSPDTDTTVFMDGMTIERDREGEPVAYVFRSRRIDTSHPDVSKEQIFHARVFND